MDYLKSYKTMSEPEKKDYLSRIDKWTEEKFPALLALADSWITVPEKDYDEGVLLASAITNARPFISVIQRYDAKRALQKLNAFLVEVREKNPDLSKMKTRPVNDKKRYRAVVPNKGVPAEDGTMQVRKFKEVDVDGRRPEHLVQYMDQLPPELTKRSEGLKEMYLALAEYRGRIEVLSENPNADPESISELANKAIKQDQEIRAFWADVDTFLEGNYNPDADAGNTAALDMKRPGDYTKEEIDAMLDPAVQEACKTARVEGNKKYLRRTDLKVTDEYKEQLELRIRELQAWGENLPKKTPELCEKAGLSIPGVCAVAATASDPKPVKKTKAKK